MTRRNRALLAGATGLLAAVAGGCNDGDAGGDTAVTTSAPAPDPATTTTGTAGTSTSAVPGGRVISVVVEGGRVQGGFRREPVTAGESVVLRVTSDTADEVHVSGYDKKADLPAGGSAEIAFRADRPGVFGVELVEERLKLVELEVS